MAVKACIDEIRHYKSIASYILPIESTVIREFLSNRPERDPEICGVGFLGVTADRRTMSMQQTGTVLEVLPVNEIEKSCCIDIYIRAVKVSSILTISSIAYDTNKLTQYVLAYKGTRATASDKKSTILDLLLRLRNDTP